MAPTARCELDFLADLARMCDAWLVADGFPLSEAHLGRPMGRPEINTLYRYFNLRRRRPAAVPRRVHRSREFNCPSEVSAGLAQVEAELLNGIDLWPRLSRRMPKPHANNDPRRNDHLLAHWDIHHLHLGLESDRLQSGQIRGTKMVLFCILDPDDAYLIQVFDHEAINDAVLLEIVRANWPHLLTPLPLHGGPAASKENIKAARESGVVPLTTLPDGFVPASRGGGFTSSGHSLRALRLATDWAKVTSLWEDCTQEALPEIVEAAHARGAAVPDVIRVELDFEDGDWSALHLGIDSRLMLPPPPDGMRLPM